jgi:periplasmic protein CpxP/Spy
MIFQPLVRRQRYLLTLVAIALSIFYSLPVFSAAFWSFRPSYSSLAAKETATEMIFADRSLSSTSQEGFNSLFQQLNLTKEQAEQIKQIHLQYQQQILSKKQDIVRLQQQLSDMLMGTEAVSLLRAKNQQLSILRQEMESLHFESMLATRETLTPQQRLKFRELVQNSASQ